MKGAMERERERQLFVAIRYLVAFVLTFQLPLPSFREKPLHDIDESRGKDALKRKRLGVTYQTV